MMIFSDSSMDVLDAAVRVSGLREQKSARKRQKLDHLSAEEKLLRRKMKNRAAAQNARDRKKAHMDELEIQVIDLVKEAKQLAAENERLRRKNAEQQKKIEELQARLAAADAEAAVAQKLRPATAEGSLEHASLVNEPLPKDQVPSALATLLLCSWLVQLLPLSMLMRMMTTMRTTKTTSWTTVQKKSSNTCHCSTIPTSSPCSSKHLQMMISPPLRPRTSLQPSLLSWWTPHHRLKT